MAVDLSHLLEQRINFLGGQFIGTTPGTGRGVEITVRAAQIAALRQVQRNQVGLPIVLRCRRPRPGQQPWAVDITQGDRIDELESVVHDDDLLPMRLSMISLRLPVFIASSMYPLACSMPASAIS